MSLRPIEPGQTSKERVESWEKGQTLTKRQPALVCLVGVKKGAAVWEIWGPRPASNVWAEAGSDEVPKYLFPCLLLPRTVSHTCVFVWEASSNRDYELRPTLASVEPEFSETRPSFSFAEQTHIFNLCFLFSLGFTPTPPCPSSTILPLFGCFFIIFVCTAKMLEFFCGTAHIHTHTHAWLVGVAVGSKSCSVCLCTVGAEHRVASCRALVELQLGTHLICFLHFRGNCFFSTFQHHFIQY